MKTNKLFTIAALFLAVMLGSAFIGTTADACSGSSCWNGYYCTSGNCGVNYYNYNYGWNSGTYYCSANYLAPFQAEFVRDVTYPDGTYVIPGSTFTKTWRLRNVGTQAWDTSTKLVYIAGDPANAVSASIPYYVAPGNSVDVSVTLTAPYYGGSVSGQWMLQSADGTTFGVGCNGQTPIWVSVKTWTDGACSCLGQPVCDCKAPSYRAGRNPYCNNKIRDIKDITYPDGSVVAPGSTFRKTWLMKNGGTCVWDQNYVLSFFYGDDLGFDGQVMMWPAGTDPVSYNGSKYEVNRVKNFYIQPGDYVYVSVDLVAPTTPGEYESYFKLRDNLGYEFGFGSYADAAFWVNVNVANEGAKEVVMEPETTIVEDSEIQIVNAAVEEVVNLCGEQSIALRNTETGYKVFWSAVNAGSKTWDGYSLVKSDSNPAVSLVDSYIAVPFTAPGETAEVTFDIALDSAASSGDPLWVEFYVQDGFDSFCEFYFEAPAK